MTMQKICIPSIIINLRDFRKYPVEWYQTINADRNGELYKIAFKIKRICGFEWGNSIAKLQSNLFIGPYHLNKKVPGKDNSWTIVVYHFAWGAVYKASFESDSDRKIPRSILADIGKRLSRVTSGYVLCRDCKIEIAYTDSFGSYYDIRYCCREHEKKYKNRDARRSL